LSYWRSKSQFEVDIIIGDDVGIEIKASRSIVKRDLKGLIAISEEKKWNHLLLVSQDVTEKKFDSGIRQVHWEIFLDELWNGNIV